MKKIKINLKDLRKSQALTQQKLAESLGISRQSIIAVETGRFLPSIELAMEMADFFHMTLDEFCNCEQIINSANAEEKENNMDKKIGPWQPSREIRPFRTAMDRLFEDFFGDDERELTFFPSVEMSRKENTLEIRSEIPGLEPDEIQVSVNDDSITIEGERKSEQEDKNKQWYRREISYGSFSRTIPLPTNVQSELAKAKFKNGILTIEVPIEKEKSKVKQVTIEKE